MHPESQRLQNTRKVSWGTQRIIIIIIIITIIVIIVILPRYSIPREWKNYAMQYKKYTTKIKLEWTLLLLLVIIIIIILAHHQHKACMQLKIIMIKCPGNGAGYEMQ